MGRQDLRRTCVLIGMILAGLLIGGCHSAIKVESVAFAHEEERIEGEGFLVLADRRVFATMTFLNTCGYDTELPGHSMHPIRIKVRELVSRNLESHPKKLQAWKDYYAQRLMGSWQYVDFALSLNSDYPFRRIRSDSELGYSWTADKLADFPEVLNDFWVTARLDEVWDQCKGDYMAEVGKYDPDKMAHQMTFLWQYLKLPRHDTYVIVQVPNPLERYYTASGARYENYFYSIDSPGSNSGLNVHEYLHTIINPLVERNYAAFKDKLDKYYEAGKDAEISKSYQNPKAFASECFVHALDYRLRGRWSSNLKVKEHLETKITKLTEGGYHLLAPFYEGLAKYEQSDLNFEQCFPILLEQLPECSS